jgi:translation initiation factor 2 alpha subunit (eIF-2alpha)
MPKNLEPGDIVMCTVDRIVGTVVFVKIDDSEIIGSIILSEIAPGRIRNLRDYVVPKKVIICKVLRVSGGHVDLSLRRVTPKEQKEIREKYKLEKSYKSILKTVLKEKADSTIELIEKESSVYNLLEEAKEDPKELEKIIGKQNTEKILEILKSQKQRKVEIKKEFALKTNKPNGIIKEILGSIKDIQVKYISAGKYYLKIEAGDPKKADNKLREILEEIEKKAKKQGLEFSIKEK